MFSRSATYATLALVELARRGAARDVRIEELAKATKVPRAFLAKLISPLARDGIVRTTRGKGGGIALARPADEITLSRALRAVDGERFAGACPFTVSPCTGRAACPLRPLWDPVRDRIVEFLETTTLAQVVARMKMEKEGT